MTDQTYKIANLPEEKLAQIKALEKELKLVLVALEPAAQVAELTPEQLLRIQEMEENLGVILMAYP